ncbi:MAG: thiamine pyrophosphate-dependent enzyme [Spirochaetota bacterium]
MKKMIIGNQAVAYGALAAGIEVAAGYPGTPSSEALTELLNYSQNNPASPYVEWSVNEKVAFEIAAGAAWTGKRALAAMKMSGANVAADSILSVAYSGTRGGLVLYIADDPGAEAGMPEQDTRLFALWAGLPVLEASNPQQAYELCRFAFELSEAAELPVILRSVTSVAHAQELVEAEFEYHSQNRRPKFERDIFRFTKAGSVICLNQHLTLLARLKEAEKIIGERGINRMVTAKSSLFAVSVGSLNPLLKEALPLQREIGAVYLESAYPLDQKLIKRVLDQGQRIVIFEELEPVVEMLIRSEASKRRFSGTILGKMDGHLPRVGKYSRKEILKGLALLKGESAEKENRKKEFTVKHPITFCAGCPHRGTYMALNRSLKKTRLGQKETIVTGDIGCTILGMNPPFDSCWTEVSMGSSLGLAQGFVRAGIEKPLVATIGDSTFFHAGIPSLINAVQHRANLLLIILDNGWTSMTGFQVNPGTEERFQNRKSRRVTIDRIVEALGVDELKVIYPFEQEEAVEVLSRMLLSEGVRVIISREECALTKGRRETPQSICEVDPGKCNFCKACLKETGCPALSVKALDEKQVLWIDPELCTGCSLCRTSCRFDAIHAQER